jgi:hypothetical protein
VLFHISQLGSVGVFLLYNLVLNSLPNFLLLLDVVQFLAVVRQDFYSLHDLLPLVVEVLVTLLDLLVEGLVLDLKLLEVD